MQAKTLLKKKYYLPILGVLIVTPLVIFALSQSQPNKPSVTQKHNTSTWKTYDEQVKEGTLQPAEKILEVLLQYDKTNPSVLTVTGFTQRNGYVASDTENKYAYVLQVLDENQNLIAEKPFNIPKDGIAETINNNGTMTTNTKVSSFNNLVVTSLGMTMLHQYKFSIQKNKLLPKHRLQMCK